jgi:N-acetylmuramic acid 6-phosphate etherase
MSNISLENLNTEKRNQATMELDNLSTIEFLNVMNQEDEKVIKGVNNCLPKIGKAVDIIVNALQNRGRLIYIGAGTSGRLGILDASECPPTFSTTDEILGIMAGGDEAIRKAKEGSEDSFDLAVSDLKDMKLTEKDVVCGIAASGRTPYVIGGLLYARSLGGKTLTISCNENSEISKYADAAIEVIVGPEVITGSTRLKAGTAQKLVLNMLSTASMVRMGKVYNNLMVDVKASNLKLIERCKKIVMQACSCSYEEAEKALSLCEYKPKTAIVMLLRGCDSAQAKKFLDENSGFVKKALIHD